MTKQEWEDLCDNCAACCFIGNLDENDYTREGGVACPHLGSDKLCTTYENRTEVAICVKVLPDNVKELHNEGMLPESCAYVRHMKGLPQLEVIPEYNLVPFLLAHPKIQERYNRALGNYLHEKARTSST